MPAKSEAQRRFVYGVKGAEFAKAHGFANRGPLPAKLSIREKRRAVRNALKGRGLLKTDPSRTATLRRSMEQALSKRFARLNLAVQRLLVDDNAFGITVNRVVVPDVQQDDNESCGAAAAMAVGRSFSVGPVTLDEWKRLLGTDKDGTDPNAIRRGLNALGLRVDARSGMELADLVRLTDRKVPVLTPVKDPDGEGHWLVVLGVSDDGVTCHDPNRGLVEIEPDDFVRRWHDRDDENRNYKRFGMAVTSSTRNAAQWQPLSSPAKVQAFQQWLRGQIKGELSDKELWHRYVQAGFRKGAARAFDDTNRSRKVMAEADPASTKRLDFYEGTRDQFLRESFAQPEAVEKVQLLAGRSFDDLENVTADMSTRMSRTLTDGLVQGQSPRQIARTMAKDVDIGKKRALLISRSEIIRAHAEGTLTALERLGIEHVGAAVEWMSTPDAKRCEACASLEGVVLTIAEARGLLPRHPNCVVGDSVIVADDVLAVMKTQYTGEIVELVTAKGRRLTVTPNHILLTEHGFLPARFAYQGLKVVDASGFDAGLINAPDNHGREASIADAFASLAKDSLMLAERVPLAPEDLHGDGAFCNAEVHIVRPDGELWRQSNPPCGGVVEGPFVSLQRADGECLLATHGAAAQLLKRVAFAADSSMGRFRDALAIRNAGLLHAKKQGFATVAGGDSSINQAAINGVATASEALAKRLCTHSLVKQTDDFISGQNESRVLVHPAKVGILPEAKVDSGFLDPASNTIGTDAELGGDFADSCSVLVQFDEIVGVDRKHVANLPVYDVQTYSTLYRVNGLVTSNCRCCWTAATPPAEPTQKIDKEEVEDALKESADLGGPSDSWPGADRTIAAKRPLANKFCPTGPGGGVDPSCGNDDRSKFIGKPVGKEEHLHADAMSAEIAAVVGGKVEEAVDSPGQKDKKPFDVRTKRRGADGFHDIEVKSLLKGEKQSLSVHEDALLRKVDHAAANPSNVFHTVAVDERATYQGGEHSGNFSGHRLYYKRGSGRYSLSQMHKVSGKAELRRLLDTPDHELPDAAKGSLPSGAAVEKLRKAAASASESRKARDRDRKERNKDQLREQARARASAKKDGA